eukprot:7391154-Prymnesium_polylepis.2
MGDAPKPAARRGASMWLHRETCVKLRVCDSGTRGRLDRNIAVPLSLRVAITVPLVIRIPRHTRPTGCIHIICTKYLPTHCKPAHLLSLT